METKQAAKIYHAVHNGLAMDESCLLAPMERKYFRGNTFKAKVKAYCEYAGLDFNPGADSTGRVRSGSEEYLLVIDDIFDRDARHWLKNY